MRKRVGGIVATAAVAVSLTGAAGASAAVEVGNDCVATNGATNFSFVQISRASASSLPLTVPAAGVVTRWKVNVGISVSLSQRLQIFRPTGRANEFRAVAESTDGAVVRGLNVFDTRIPVQAGDLIGALGVGASGAPLYCSTSDAGDVMGTLTPPAANGSTNTFSPITRLLVAVSAIVEPDVDGDGFGDESQDKCPQSSAFQVACPVITLDTLALVKRGSIVVMVTSSSESPVTVSATTGAKKGRKGKGGRRPRATASALIKLRGGTKTVAPGQIVPFKLRFNKALKAQLDELPPGRSLTLRVTARAIDVAGRRSSSVLRVKLKG